MMLYKPFYERFPELAEKETRSFIALENSDLPVDEYLLLESYCDEPGCDCRRVFLNVISKKSKEILAVITYGWASKKYYAKWLGEYNPDLLKELKGPALNSARTQSRLSPAILNIVTHILKDKSYVNRLKRHYALFKEAVNTDESEKSRNLQIESKKKVKRNVPCSCGSGKKYKRCCGK